MKYLYSFALILIFQSAFSQNDYAKAGFNVTKTGIQELNSGSYDEFRVDNRLDLPNRLFQNSNYFDQIEAGVPAEYGSYKNGIGIANKQIAELGIPKFFTPNGDGYNDIWKIAGNSNTNTTLDIFDQFGKLIKHTQNTNEGWDGTYNGLILPENDYWFVLSLEDGSFVKGHFALVL